ncbi:WD40 repeat domain-containing protein [Blastopirellula marina]|uniref:Uncharacterized protein n=1 Tax=Blastopirellula marina DSM 3645 TaxID=314230 RepID=A3ZZZ3_9BACT|nr:WD40 repeat domain-containing protein [Blastopirellula marina]EAQ77937.1 hypothetical protein DSM3645_27201 [Blastopirellula marina DSM 3645]
MIFFVCRRSTRWFAVGCFLLASSASIALRAQGQAEETPQPEIFTREYPDVKEFNTPSYRPIRVYPMDEVAKLAPWNPLTTGKSDEQLVDEIERLRASDLQPKFVHVRTAPLNRAAIVAADVSADGKTLLTYDAEQRLTTWSLPDGEQLVEFALDKASEQAAIAISSDGLQVLFGDASSQLLLFDAKTGRLEFTHDQLEFPIAAAAFSLGGARIAATDVKGHTYIAEPKAAGEVQKEKNIADLRPQIDVAVGDSGAYASAIASPTSVLFSTKIGISGGNISHSPYPIAGTAANNRQVLLVDNQKITLAYKHPENYKFTGTDEPSFLACYSARFDLQSQTAWITTEGGIDVRVVNYLPLFDLVRYPQIDQKIDQVLTAPDDNLLVLITKEGQADLWRLEGNQAAIDAELIRNLHALLEENRFAALELLAKRWSQLPFDLYDKEQQTLYYFLLDVVRNYKTNHWQDRTKSNTYKKFVVANPDCEFFRIVLTMDAIEMAWDCRGRGFAAGVDEKELKYFKMNLEQAANMLMPLFQRAEPPCPEAYAQAMELSKVEQWSDDATAYLYSEAQRNAPTYSRIWGEAAVGLMPRWGGAPDSSAKMAKDIADVVGGDDGDILYANIARCVRNYHGWEGTFESLQFSQPRVMQGYAKMALRDSTRQNMNLSQALMLARELNDRQTARQLAEHFDSIGAVPALHLWPGGLPEFEEVMTWTLKQPYQLARIEPKLPSATAQDLAPTDWELAKVEELDAIARGTNHATFTKGTSFSVGNRRPWKMELASDATRAVTIDQSGDLQVWNVASGEQLLQLTGDDAPGKGAVALSHDGKSMVVGSVKGTVELRDADTGKVLYQATGFEAPMVDAGMSTDGKHFYTVDEKAGVHIFSKGNKNSWAPQLLNPKNERLLEPVAVAIDLHGSYLQARRYKDRVEVMVIVPNAKGVTAKPATIRTSGPTQVVSGRYRYAVVTGDNIVKIVITSFKDASFEAFSQRMLQDVRRAKFSIDGRQLWCSTDRCIDIRDWDGGQHEGPVKLPAEISSGEGIRLAPDAGAFVNFDSKGTATVWTLEGNPLSREYLLAAELIKLMNEGRYDTLELLADHWADDNTPALDAIDDNLYSSLIMRLNLVAVRTGGAAGQEQKLREYLQVYPDSKLMRLALFELKYDLARQARGDKPNAATPGALLSDYRKRLEECKEILTPLIQRKDTPPEAYAAAIRLGRESGWDRSKMKFLLDRGMEAAPAYGRIYAETTMALLPEFGGSEGVAQQYAKSVADRIGGKQGDAAYFQIALCLSKTEGWPAVLKELNFSRERLLSGLVEIAQEHPRRHLIRTGMQLAQEGGDQAAGAAIAKIIQDQAFVPDDFQWPKGANSFDKAMQWATGQ